MMKQAWTEADVPDQTGRTAVVTGANTGIGLEIARVLAARGATVVLACRNLEKAQQAANRITAAPGARPDLLRLDLGSLASVRAAATKLRHGYDQIDLLINNAGVANVTERTEDGFEPQFGINHLGHFAFTGLVLDRLLAAPASRIVVVSSFAHRTAKVEFEQQHGDRNQYPWSKLANLMFMHELHRRLSAAEMPTITVAAHPGLAKTEVMRYASRAFRTAVLLATAVAGHSSRHAALPTLRAATDPAVAGGEFYGPSLPGGTRGRPVPVDSGGPPRDKQLCRRLWDESERLTGVKYDL
ncbi:MAG: family NAD(P)-dependent oxidoreductase [Actinoallomurus sp.]|nr:family NAD(P)-dependent oxidoreductase [Actinoallomurus sp.]